MARKSVWRQRRSSEILCGAAARWPPGRRPGFEGRQPFLAELDVSPRESAGGLTSNNHRRDRLAVELVRDAEYAASMTFGWLVPARPRRARARSFHHLSVDEFLDAAADACRSMAADRGPSRSPVRNQPSVKFAAVIVGSPRYPRTTVVPAARSLPRRARGSGSPSTRRSGFALRRPADQTGWTMTGVSVWSIPQSALSLLVGGFGR